MSNYDYEDAQETLAYIQKFLPFNPEIAITSGSGLGDIAALVENPVTLSAEDIPHWPTSTAPGHSGKIIVGKIHGNPVILLDFLQEVGGLGIRVLVVRTGHFRPLRKE